MKTRMIVSTLLILLLTVGISFNSNANPWRGGYRHGWSYRPVVRVGIPAVGIGVAPVVVGGGYYGGYYPRPAYYGGYYAAGPRFYGGYGHGYYGRGYGGHGYYHGGGYRGGYHGRR